MSSLKIYIKICNYTWRDSAMFSQCRNVTQAFFWADFIQETINKVNFELLKRGTSREEVPGQG